MKRLVLIFLISQSSIFGMGSERVLEFLQAKEIAKDVIGAQIADFLEKEYFSLMVKKLEPKDIQHIKNLVHIHSILSAKGRVKPFAQEHIDQALFYAVEFNNIELVKLFLEVGANPNSSYQRNKWIYTRDFNLMPSTQVEYPILIAPRFQTEILKLLLEYGGDPNFKVGWGLGLQTPLLVAATTTNFEAIKLLIHGVIPIKRKQEFEYLRSGKTYFSLLPSELLNAQVAPYLSVKADLNLYNQGKRALEVVRSNLDYWRKRGSNEQELSKFKKVIELLEEEMSK